MRIEDWNELLSELQNAQAAAKQIPPAVSRYTATDALVEWFYGRAEQLHTYTLVQYQRLLRRRTALRLLGAGKSEMVVRRALQLVGEPPHTADALDCLEVDLESSNDDDALLLVNDILPAMCVPHSNDPFWNLLCAPSELKLAILWRPRVQDLLVFRSPHTEYRYLIEDSLPLPTGDATGTWSLAGLQNQERGIVPAWVLPPGIESLGEYRE
jgi:hypothetical protein